MVKNKRHNTMILSILIPTIEGREEQFLELYDLLSLQKRKYDNVEILFLKDNKEMPLGLKRQCLYNLAKGEYSIQIDDDENVHEEFIDLIMEALKYKPDCVTFKEQVICGDQILIASHSIRHKGWGDNMDGYTFVRTPYYKDVIRTDIAKKVGLNPKMRFGEDKDFADRLHHELKNEIHIDDCLIEYTMYHATADRYGVK